MDLKRDFENRKKLALALKREQVRTLDGLYRLNKLYKQNLLAKTLKFVYLKAAYDPFVKFSVRKDEFYVDLTTTFAFTVNSLECDLNIWRKAHTRVTDIFNFLSAYADEKEISLCCDYFEEKPLVD